MSKIEMLRLLINQRLTAAAEEIFGVFGRTIAEYEEEISRSKLEIERQRRLLDLSRKPQVSLQVSGTGRYNVSVLCDPQRAVRSGPGSAGLRLFLAFKSSTKFM